MSGRSDRVEILLKELAADFINEESNRQSMITVTGIDLSPDMKIAKILVSIFPDTDAESVIHFLRRRRPEFRLFVKGKANLKNIPTFDFALDEGEKRRQHIDDLLR